MEKYISHTGRVPWLTGGKILVDFLWLGRTGSLVVLVSSLRYLINIHIWLDEWVFPRAQGKYPEHLRDLPTYVGPESFLAKGAINKSESWASFQIPLYSPLWHLETKSGFHTNTGYAVGSTWTSEIYTKLKFNLCFSEASSGFFHWHGWKCFQWGLMRNTTCLSLIILPQVTALGTGVFTLSYW